MKNRVRKNLSFMSRHKIATRVLSMSLSLILLFYVVPTVVYGEIIDAFSRSSDSDTEQSTLSDGSLPDGGSGQYSVSYPLYEVNELRGANVKHFRLSDGSYVAAQYPATVHYRDTHGAWQDIDNVLTEDSGGELSTSNAKVKFAKKITGSETLFTLHDGNTKITLSLVGAIKKTEGKVTNGSDSETDTELQKMMNLEKLSSSIVYEI